MIETKSNITYIELEKIRLDGGTQPRMKIDESVVDEYAELMQDGTVFPAVIVFSDRREYWLADGFHRWHAAKKIGRETISAEIRFGSQRDAILYSLGANTSHGLRRTNADKRKAVEILLKDETWRQWSGREIAKRCGVGETMVRRIRDSLNALKAQNENSGRTFIHHKTGKETTMNTAKIGAKNSSGKSRKVKKRLAGIRSGLSDDLNIAARELLGVKGKSYCRGLLDTLGQLIQTADSQEVDSNE